MGLGCVADLSAAVFAPNGAQSWTAGRSCAAGAVPSAGALPRRSRPDQVHARSPARPPGAPHRIQVTWSMRIAYLVNQYPTVSHSFIRREILALERRGVEVMRIALREWDRELLDAENQLERERTRYVLREGAPALADCPGADAAHAAGATAAGTGAGVAHGSPRGPSAARAPHLPGRGLPHRALAARGGRPASACAFRHQFGRGRDAGACLGRAAMELHRPRAEGIRQCAAHRLGREDPALCVRRGDQLIRPEPTLPLGGARALAQGEGGPLRAREVLFHGGREPCPSGAAPRLRGPAVRAKRAVAVGGGRTSPCRARDSVRAGAGWRRRTALRDRGVD